MVQKKMLDSLKANITLTQKMQPASERNAAFFVTSVKQGLVLTYYDIYTEE
jgi:hypothetical protein